MPIHEYLCQDCGAQFEQLVRASDTPECPRCHSVALEKKLSVFASPGSGAESKLPEMAAAGPCGSCGHPGGPGACGWQNG